MFSNKLICNILDYIDSNINDDISVSSISDVFGYEKSYVMKRFKKELGITITNYINSIRIYNSLNHFATNKSILDIAIDNGFNSLEYYSETFKKIMKISPRSYKKFVMRSSNLTLNELNIIMNSMSSLNTLNKIVREYRMKYRDIKNPVMKLAITRIN